MPVLGNVGDVCKPLDGSCFVFCVDNGLPALYPREIPSIVFNAEVRARTSSPVSVCGRLNPKQLSTVSRNPSSRRLLLWGISRGFFENVNEQWSCNDLCHRVLFTFTAVCQIIKLTEKVRKAGVDYFSDTGQQDFCLFRCGGFLTRFSQ